MQQRSFTASSGYNLPLKAIALLLTLLGSALFCEPAAAQDPVYLFSYFQETNGQNGLHIAYSLDGLSYHAVNGDAGIVLDTQPSPFMRDPSITYGPDGVFHMTYTTAWYVTNFGYMDSTDLFNWNNKKQVNIMGSVPTTRQVWAPESFWDAATNQYIVYWSSEVTSAASGLRTYYATTTDFSNFSTPAVLYDPGFSTIDTTIVKDGANFRLIAKDERNGYKYIYKTPDSTSALGPYPTSPLQRVTGTGYQSEGPTVIKIGDNWYVFNDHFSSNVMGAVVSTDDMATWTEYTKGVSFPYLSRHGTVLTVPYSVAQNLAANAANKPREDEFVGSAGTADFHTASNWFAGSVPGGGQIPVIQGGYTVNMTSSPSGTLSGINVGQTSTGTLNISNRAAMTISASWPYGLIVGDRVAANGTLVQSGSSSVTVLGFASIGRYGNGTYRLQDSSSLYVTGDFNVGDIRGSHGNLYLQNGSLSAAAFYVGAGYNGDSANSGATGNAVGAVYQSGGIVSVSGSGDYLVIGGRDTAYGVGSYELSDGTLSAGANANILVGKYGQGTFTQSGGTLNAGQWLYISRYSSSSGSYAISGGTVNQTNSGARLCVGYGATGSLTVSGTGLVNLTGGLRITSNSSGNGQVHLDGGTIFTPLVEDSGGTAAFHFNGGTLKAKNTTTTFMQGLDSADVEAGGAVIDTNGFNVTIAQALSAASPSGGLTKTGQGLLTLSGACTYTGSTQVNAGALLVDGSLASPVTVNNNGTIGGIGSIGGLTVNSGGTLAPGDSPGILTVNGNVTLGGTYACEINAIAGAGYDQLSVNGTVTLGGVLMLSVSTPSLNDKFWILLNDGADALNGSFSNYANGDTVFSFDSTSWHIYYGADSATGSFSGGNDVLLAVPEPSAWLLLLLAAAAVCLKRLAAR